jgi:hypothetical protein
MKLREIAVNGSIVVALTIAAVSSAPAQANEERYTATASVKTAGAAAASAPVTIIVSRKMSQGEADKLTAAFTTGGVPALRKALVGVPVTGSIQLGGAQPTPTRLTLERLTDKGRLLTIVTDQPILFMGAGLPDAKAKAGYDFGILDMEVNEAGTGSGSLAPAAKVTVKQGAFVVEDYAAELVRLTDVKKVK